MPDIDAAIQGARRYWYEDGLTEIGAGVVFLAIGLLFAFESQAEQLPVASLSAIGLPVVVIGGGWLVGRLVTAVKERFTYPRTGYLAYRKPPRRQRVAMGILAAAVALAAVIALGWLATSTASEGFWSSFNWIPLLDGLVIGTAFLYLGRQLGLRRFHVLAGAAAAFGVAAALLTSDSSAGSAAFFAASGLALVASGSHALGRYWRQTQPPAGGPSSP